MTAAEPIRQLRVLVADDHAPTREDVRRALAEGGMDVCAEAADAAHAVQLALEEKPDICLLDIRMPGGGVAAAWEIARRLQLKPSGIRAHISAIVQKLGVADRDEAVAFFRETSKS